MSKCLTLLSAVLITITASCLSDTASAQGQTLQLDFSSAVPGTIQDISGNGTGLADRLPGTGSGLLTDDANLALDPTNGLLTILSTNSDLNGQQNLATGEYLGTSLASLGFTGHGNFRVQAKFVNIQYANDFDQFGLYVAADSSHIFRCGWGHIFNPATLATINNGGFDSGGGYSSQFVPAVGDTLVLTLSRTRSTYAVTIHNLTHPGRSGTLDIAQPSFLNPYTNLYVGVFAANSGNGNVKTMTVDQYNVKVQ
jgi:regulation of enolase protein 1 (concanavalin A-like superfamily)